MQLKTLFFFLLLGVLYNAVSASNSSSEENQHIVMSVQRAGGCCGPVNEDCGKCTPKGQMPGFKTGYSCCLPVVEKMEKKIAGTGPTYWCCECGYPALQPQYGQPCCAGHC